MTVAASPFIVLVTMSSVVLTLQPKELAVEGTYVHPGSGHEFPEHVAEFRREKVREYGPNDIGIGYNLVSGRRPIAATVYVYPLQGIPFDAELSAIEELKQNYELELERDVRLTNGRSSLDCRLAAMSHEDAFAGHQMRVKSYLLVCDDQPWRVKWRITHPAMTDGDIEAVIESLAAPLTVREQKSRPRL
jgi:hypothetical protein